MSHTLKIMEESNNINNTDAICTKRVKKDRAKENLRNYYIFIDLQKASKKSIKVSKSTFGPSRDKNIKIVGHNSYLQ